MMKNNGIQRTIGNYILNHLENAYLAKVFFKMLVKYLLVSFKDFEKEKNKSLYIKNNNNYNRNNVVASVI